MKTRKKRLYIPLDLLSALSTMRKMRNITQIQMGPSASVSLWESGRDGANFDFVSDYMIKLGFTKEEALTTLSCAACNEKTEKLNKSENLPRRVSLLLDAFRQMKYVSNLLEGTIPLESTSNEPMEDQDDITTRIEF